MRRSDGWDSGNDSLRRLSRTHAFAAARPRAAAAACALLLAALVWTIAGAGHAQAKRTASPSGPQVFTGAEGTSESGFGTSVAVSADGSTAIAGGPAANGHKGAAWVFTNAGGTWVQQGPALTAEPEGSILPCGEVGEEPEVCGFGRSVALSANGDVALVGAPRTKEKSGAAWVYTRSEKTWSKTGKLVAGEEVGAGHFGRSVALSADGTIAIVGGATDSSSRGAVWTYVHTSSGWKQQSKLTAPPEAEGKPGEGFFGASVSLAQDGLTALIGAPGTSKATGAAWLFARSGETWTVEKAPLLGGGEETGAGRFGISVALSANGTTALVGGRTDNGLAGAAWAFARGEDSWSQVGPKLTSGETGATAFGWSVALSASGEEALVGGPANEKQLGAAWLFKRSGSAYGHSEPKITGGGEPLPERVGSAVALSQAGTEALIGAPNTAAHTGAALGVFGIAVPPPTVTSVSPKSGPSAGGTAVTIEGTGFLPGAKVKIGSEATSVEVISETQLTARTAATKAGTDEVVVSDEYGTSTGGPSYTYEPPPAPVVTSINPPAGPAEGGTLVTIEGTGFTPDVKVTIGGQATEVEVVSETKLIARTPATATGIYEVVVSNEGGSSAGGPKFTYVTSPIVQSVLIVTPKIEVLGTSAGPPVLGVSGDIEPKSGKVFVRLPGTHKFVPLTGLRNIPFGTIVDAREGNATVTTIGPTGPQTVNLYEGEFKLTQSSNGVVTATLFGGNFKVCPTKRERAQGAHTSAHHASRSHIVRKLWASGHGKYTTKGNYATGAVLGTVWETIDRCNGTGIKVITDSVLVTNLVTHKKVRVKAGHTYIVKAP